MSQFLSIFPLQGTTANLPSATLPELARIHHLNYEELGLAVAMRAVGKIPGCITGGLLYSKCLSYCDLYLMAALLVGASVVAATPYAPSAGLLALCFGMQGAVEQFCMVGK